MGDDDLASDSFSQHIWFRAMGEEYIQTALSAAHAADPDAKLYINDFGLEEDGERWSAMLALVTKLKSQGVPLDGVGLEAHIYEAGDEIDPTVLRSHIKALAAVGLNARISEMDVHSDNGAAAQAKQYVDVFKVCLSEPTCVSWSTWGVTDRYDMSQSDTNRLQYGQDFLWDTSVTPTPALESIKQTLLLH
jgi:endo-1,4-beta-xylanase